MALQLSQLSDNARWQSIFQQPTVLPGSESGCVFEEGVLEQKEVLVEHNQGDPHVPRWPQAWHAAGGFHQHHQGQRGCRLLL